MRSESEISVLIVDDHPVFADGLQALLEAEPDLTVLATAGDLAAARAIVATEPVDVVLMDLRLPDGTGVDGVREVKKLSPTSSVVILTAHADDAMLLDAIDAGCSGFLTKAGRTADVVGAVRAAAAGEALITPDLLGRLLPRLRSRPAAVGADLTAREREVMALVAEGLTNADIAARLHVSVHTVRNHTQNVLAKLGAHSKLEALAVAVREGVVELG